jgi:hypothetical protein
MVFAAKSGNAKQVRQIAPSSGIAASVAAQESPEHGVQMRRACQRFALQATAQGLKTTRISQPAEVPGPRADLAAPVGLPGRRPDNVMRFGRADPMQVPARRPVDPILI